MRVTELPDQECPYCGGSLGVGAKEEPTQWKVYAVCLERRHGRFEERVGTIPREPIGHIDEVWETAERLVGRTVF